MLDEAVDSPTEGQDAHLGPRSFRFRGEPPIPFSWAAVVAWSPRRF